MAAIMGFRRLLSADVCKRAAEGEVCCARELEFPDQTVISGHADAIKRAVETGFASGRETRRHSGRSRRRFIAALMMPAQEKLEKDLREDRVRGVAHCRWSPTSTPTHETSG